VKAYGDTLDRHPARRRIVDALNQGQLIDMYRRLVRARLHDITLQRWVRLGTISKAWLGTGEEAATVGPVFALDPKTDFVAPMIRNAAACADMGMPLADMFRAYLASADSPSGGRDLHAGDFEHHVLQPVSPIGLMVPVTAGLALAAKIRDQPAIVLNWIGDGSTKAAATHEGLNFAAVQRLPAIFIIQNNQVALGTRVNQHHLGGNLNALPAAYGVAGWTFDGNNVLDAYAATQLAVDRIHTSNGPVMLVASTFRMGGHATHDEREARETLPAELFSHWGRRDPIGLYEEYLKAQGVSTETLEAAESDAVQEIEEAEQDALASRERLPDPVSALGGVYASSPSRLPLTTTELSDGS
jgi:TPP-dependent pyruvate/acetoin dehydrogenase alpha subunit